MVGMDFFSGFCIIFLTFSIHKERMGVIQLTSQPYSIKRQIYLWFFSFALSVQLSPSILSNNLLKFPAAMFFREAKYRMRFSKR